MAVPCCKEKNTNILVYILVCLFAISSWIDLNGIWVELPILVGYLPEGWKLPSYMAVIVQLANIGPLLFVLSDICYPSKVKERVVIYGIIAVGMAACSLLIFFWKSTSYIFGEEHSTALLSLIFFLSLVDCTSSVTFLPFMASFKSQYITALYIGEGLSGMLPSIVSIIQGAGNFNCVETVNTTSINGTLMNVTSYTPVYEEPLFSVQHFFVFITSMMGVSGLAFYALNNFNVCKKETQQHFDNVASSYSTEDSYSKKDSQNTDMDSSQYADNAESSPFHNSGALLIKGSKQESLYTEDKPTVTLSVGNKQSMSKFHYSHLMLQIFWANALMNGVLTSIQPYSCIPYGTNAYHLSVTLAAMTNPIACFISFFLPITSKSVISLLTAIGTGLAAFIMALAVSSPDPPLEEDTIGVILVVAAWALVSFVFTYAKVSIAALFRIQGRKALLWCGAVTQVGSAIGSITMFVLVNVLEVFISAPPCP